MFYLILKKKKKNYNCTSFFKSNLVLSINLGFIWFTSHPRRLGLLYYKMVVVIPRCLGFLINKIVVRFSLILSKMDSKTIFVNLKNLF